MLTGTVLTFTAMECTMVLQGITKRKTFCFLKPHVVIKHVFFCSLRYSIINFQKRQEEIETEGGQRWRKTVSLIHVRKKLLNFKLFFRELRNFYDWKNVGTFYDRNFFGWDETFFNKFRNDSTINFCQRKPCKASEVKVQNTDDSCCWHCVECNDFQKKVF